jgi:hypothetical protein
MLYSTPREPGVAHDPSVEVCNITVRQAQAAVMHFYKNKVLPAIADYDEEKKNAYFYTWLLHAIPNKVPGWDVDKWKEVFVL